MRMLLMLALSGALAACTARYLPRPYTATPAWYPEGPVVTRDGLLFVEFTRDRVMRWRDGHAASVWHSPGCGPAGLAAARDGSLWIACYTRHQLLHLRPGKKPVTEAVYDIPYPNDIAVDGHGGVYVTASGIFDPDAPASGAIYYIDARGQQSRVARDIHYSNGVALSQEETRLRVSEHLQNRVRNYRITTPGTLDHNFSTLELDAWQAHPETADETLLGPDGLNMDASGNLWVAHYAGGRLLHINAAGEARASVSFAPPFINVTNVATHPDGRLFVTVTSDDAQAGHPGAVVALNPAALDSHVLCTVAPPHVHCVPR